MQCISDLRIATGECFHPNDQKPLVNLYEPLSRLQPTLVITEHGQVIDRVSPHAIKMPSHLI